MPLIKLSTSSPFANIKTWLFEKSKLVILNPLSPSSATMKKEKTINVTNLEKILTATHAPNGKINKIIDAVNDLIKRVTQNEADIEANFDWIEEIEMRLDTTMSTIGHTHSVSSAPGMTTPSTGRKGGSVRKMQSGGEFTKPVPTSMKQWKQKLIAEIKDLQNTSG